DEAKLQSGAHNYNPRFLWVPGPMLRIVPGKGVMGLTARGQREGRGLAVRQRFGPGVADIVRGIVMARLGLAGERGADLRALTRPGPSDGLAIGLHDLERAIGVEQEARCAVLARRRERVAEEIVDRVGMRHARKRKTGNQSRNEFRFHDLNSPK